MLGGTDVVTRIRVDELNCIDIGLIQKAMERADPEDLGFIQHLTDSSLTKPLKIVQAFMGDQIGIRGTIGNPTIISPYIRDFAEVLESTLMSRTFQSEFMFMPPLNDEVALTHAFSKYLMRFVYYG